MQKDFTRGLLGNYSLAYQNTVYKGQQKKLNSWMVAGIVKPSAAGRCFEICSAGIVRPCVAGCCFYIDYVVLLMCCE